MPRQQKGRALVTNEDEERYQGKEIQATLKAPSMAKLNEMLVELDEYAKEFQMDEINVLQKGKDPDGGYQAIIVAHNWNPFKWIAEKYRAGVGEVSRRVEARAGGPEARAEVAKRRREYEQKARLARLEARARLEAVRLGVKEKTAEELIEEKERLKRERALRRIRPTISTEGAPEESMSEFLFG